MAHFRRGLCPRRVARQDCVSSFAKWRTYAESQELPDHLTHVLALLGRLTGDDADELAARYVLPGLDKMITSADADKHPYLAIIKAIRIVVQTDHDVEPITPREQRKQPPDWKNRLPMYSGRPVA